ncbi:hypothetical protein Fmac_017304 [Flemingia macrophylla]|uniref:Uncharacterized protein n=1 Tax=Flemingia macrophylla TaxID=520843 RepID=A0ABD1M1T1_9FABA
MISENKAPEDIEPPDSKVGQQKPRKGGGRTRVKRTHTEIKAVLKDILGEAAEALPVDDHETEFPDGNESQKTSNRRIPSLKGVERRDGDGGDSAGAFANDMAMSEEVNGTADDVEENDGEHRSESHGGDAGVDNEDDDYQQPGEASIGEKLWNFFIT